MVSPETGPEATEYYASVIRQRVLAQHAEGARNLAAELRRLERYLAERRVASARRVGYVDLSAVIKVTEESLAGLAARAETLSRRQR